MLLGTVPAFTRCLCNILHLVCAGKLKVGAPRRTMYSGLLMLNPNDVGRGA